MKKLFPLDTVECLDFEDFPEDRTPAPIINLSKVQHKQKDTDEA